MASALQSSTRSGHFASNDVRVLIVDDSAVIRGMMSKWLSEEKGIEVLGTAANGEAAIREVGRLSPDLVLLDIEMPLMDGLTALPKMLDVDPELKVVMASTLTQRNAEISLKAMAAGAVDYLPKPTAQQEMHGASEYRRMVVEKVRTIGKARRRRIPQARKGAAGAVTRPAAKGSVTPLSASRATTSASSKANFSLRPMPRIFSKPGIITIGSSTGGPQALLEVLKPLRKSVTQPILITQHMPSTFTRILAEHLKTVTGGECKEAEHGETIQAGKTYIAPGDYHMVVTGDRRKPIIELNQEPPENFCRPAVDPLFRSAARVFGSALLAAVLTGMGRDGCKGGEAVVSAGGVLVGQDEDTSVVWGMPGAVAQAGLCSAVLPLNEIAGALERLAKERPL